MGKDIELRPLDAIIFHNVRKFLLHIPNLFLLNFCLVRIFRRLNKDFENFYSNPGKLCLSGFHKLIFNSYSNPPAFSASLLLNNLTIFVFT